MAPEGGPRYTTHFFRPTASEMVPRAQETPKSATRGFQDAPERPPSGPRGQGPEAPQTAQEAPGAAKMPRGLQEAPKSNVRHSEKYS